MDFIPQPILGALATVVMVAVFAGLVRLIAWAPPWSTLADAYETTAVPGRTRWFRSATLAGRQYNGTLVGAGTPEGLYLRLHFLFLRAPRPILIPWADLSAHWERHLFERRLVLRAARCPDVAIQLRRPFVRQLDQQAGEAWSPPEEI